MNQKGASAILVTSLIIVVVVILSVIFFAWSKNYSKEQMDVTSGQIKQASDLSCLNAKFRVSSCKINPDTKAVSLVFMNSSDLKIYNLVLTIHTSETIISGAFEKIVDSGEITTLSTNTNFSYTKGQTEHANIDVTKITDIVLTNGTCPKKVFALDCDIE